MKTHVKFFISYFFVFWIALSFNYVFESIFLQNYFVVDLQSFIGLFVIASTFIFLHSKFLNLNPFNGILFLLSFSIYFILCGIHNLQELHFYLEAFETRQIETLSTKSNNYLIILLFSLFLNYLIIKDINKYQKIFFASILIFVAFTLT